jgi:hypothetical protein
MSPQPQQQSEWLSKRDAARMLGVSERQIERRAAAGTIRSRRDSRRPDQTAAPVLFSREDVEAIKAGTPNYHPVVEKAPLAQLEASESKGILPAAPVGLGSLLEHVAQRLGPVRPEPKPWLNLEDAVAYSGLPEGLLKHLGPELLARGDALRYKRAWYFRRAALPGPLSRGLMRVEILR